MKKKCMGCGRVGIVIELKGNKPLCVEPLCVACISELCSKQEWDFEEGGLRE